MATLILSACLRKKPKYRPRRPVRFTIEIPYFFNIAQRRFSIMSNQKLNIKYSTEVWNT